MEIIATREKRDVLPYYIPYFGGLGSNRIRTEAAEKIKTIIRAERWRVKRFLPDYKKQLGVD